MKLSLVKLELGSAYALPPAALDYLSAGVVGVVGPLLAQAAEDSVKYGGTVKLRGKAGEQYRENTIKSVSAASIGTSPLALAYSNALAVNVLAAKLGVRLTAELPPGVRVAPAAPAAPVAPVAPAKK